jgi:hypothetical protein
MRSFQSFNLLYQSKTTDLGIEKKKKRAQRLVKKTTQYTVGITPYPHYNHTLLPVKTKDVKKYRIFNKKKKV